LKHERNGKYFVSRHNEFESTLFCWFILQVPLGVIFKNENINEDMLVVLQQFHAYLPRKWNGDVDLHDGTAALGVFSGWGLGTADERCLIVYWVTRYAASG